MKLQFHDEIQRDAIDLYFEIKGEAERDISAIKADIEWSLILSTSSWGVEAFNYELNSLTIPMNIDTVTDKGTVESTTLFADIRFSGKNTEKTYMCRIYEEVQENNKWIEEDYVIFPISLIVEEKPATDLDNRSQIFVKYI